MSSAGRKIREWADELEYQAESAHDPAHRVAREMREWLDSWPVCVCPDCIRCGCNQPWDHHANMEQVTPAVPPPPDPGGPHGVHCVACPHCGVCVRESPGPGCRNVDHNGATMHVTHASDSR